jgi:DNA-binding NtrC family response regulator
LLCRINLELEGYRVLEASSRAELMSALAAEPVAAILLDVHLGEDDGIEITRELHGSHPEIGIALFTGSVDAAQVSAGGVTDAFLAKPFTLEELSGIVARVARS